jgi:hypothetical protein
MISNNTKFIIGASIAVLIIGIVIFLIVKNWKKNVTRSIKVDESNLSYEQSQYTLWASQLFTAMDGIGTDEDTILRIVQKIKNQDDWNQLVKSFGVREASAFTSSFSGTLLDWLADELSTNDYNKCIEILAKVGVSI